MRISRTAYIPSETHGFRAKQTPKTKKWFVVAVDKNGQELGRVWPSTPRSLGGSLVPSRLRYSDRQFVEWIVWAMNEAFHRGRESSWRHSLQESELPK